MQNQISIFNSNWLRRSSPISFLRHWWRFSNSSIPDAGRGLEITVAVGTSLMAVGTFGIVSASTYALYHEIDLIISILYLLGGIAGSMLELK